jgi:diguanylate cyclase (GGDEF)-like protein/putative nucleotidyltransferase with HDIG domain
VFGTQPRTRRPLLLLLVFGAFLVIIGVTATAQAVMVSLHFSTGTLNTVVASDSATVRAVLNDSLQLSDLDPSGPTGEHLAQLQAELAALTSPGEIVRVELRRLDGTIVAASASGLTGVVMPVAGPAASAGAGQASIEISPAAEAAAGPGDLGTPSVLREFLPISTGGQVRAIVGIWRDAVPLLDRLDSVRRDIVLVTLAAGIVASLVLFLIFRAAQGRLTRQTAALVESTRRDPLTNLLNHGALVGHLATEIEHARVACTPFGLALIDIDNFRLLNDNHGHRAGDEALLAVAGELRRQLPPSATMGRYGPDEFLVIAPAETVVDLEPAIAGLRAALADLSLQFESTERLPITVSAGLCSYPDQGLSVTPLLAAAARVLEEAKASGGDTVKVADEAESTESTASGFDVLQGLVLAVDTKDRYTKRHSEDVARYAAYLAERMGLDAEFVRTIHRAGLLHDVGKIGIPDPILRKPGKLTAAEYDIVKQHVALGDMIVRDVPDIDLVRAGIRNHHERWDGDGYLDRLEGEDIPLIARILAVGDAFSAMTTTRPYRKALDIREALRRLEDASATQLDERLVRVFIAGIESDANAPLPGADAPTRLWRPRRVA